MLFFRGGDKINETKLPSYQEYIDEIRKNHEHENLKYLIQSDESEFIEEMMNVFTEHDEIKINESKAFGFQSKNKVGLIAPRQL